MIYHVLNGDGLAENFDLEGEIIVCREALIDGDLQTKNLNEFWKVRAEYVKKNYGADDYFVKVKDELENLNRLKPTDEVNLWFGNEAFCAVNLWFVLSLINEEEAKIFRVFSDSENWNCCFNDLADCLSKRRIITKEDIRLGVKLWNAFIAQEFEGLEKLGETESAIFPNLKTVCQALAQKDTKPKEILREITKNGETDFGKIYTQFKEKAGVYGFGDLQVKNILAKL